MFFFFKFNFFFEYFTYYTFYLINLIWMFIYDNLCNYLSLKFLVLR